MSLADFGIVNPGKRLGSTPAGRKAYKNRSKKKRPSLVKKIKSVVNHMAEKQFWNFNSTTTTGYTWQYFNIAAVPQATTASTDSVRHGDEIRTTSLNLNYTAWPGSTSETLRVIIYRVKYGISEDNYMITSASAGATVSQFRHDTRDHIEVLWDRTHVLNTYNPLIEVRTRLPLRNKAIHYDGGSTTYEKGGLCMAVASSNTTAGTLLYDFRLNYTDI